METRPKRFTYQTRVRWSGEKKGTLLADGKPDLQTATPPEFKGHAGIWSPEDLFVASANVCLMTTFLALAERASLGFTGYESEAEGVLESVEGRFAFTQIVIRPKITMAPGVEKEKADEVIRKAETHCLVSNSMRCRVVVEPTFL